MERHRYTVLDTYRFVAAIGVVAYHFEAHFAPFLAHPRDMLFAFQTLVDFFFVLSGFVLMHTYGGAITDLAAYRDFLRKRLARIYPLHAATLGLCVILLLVVRIKAIPVRDPAIIDMSVFWPNVFLVQAWGVTDHPGLNGPAWSISAEAFVYLLFPLFVALAGWLRPWKTFCVAALFAFVVEVARAAAGLPSGDTATFDFGMLRAVPMFLSGIATYQIVSTLRPRALSWLIPHSLFAAILALMIVKAPLYLIDALYPPLVALIAMAERGGRPTRLATPLAGELGQASFAIYMIHTFVQIPCVGLIRHFGWSGPFALTCVALGGTGVIILLGLASFRFFETPMRRWLGGPPRKPTTPSPSSSGAFQARVPN